MITLQSNVIDDEYTEIAYRTFDVPKEEKSIIQIKDNIELPTHWNIGVVYGASGTGKSTILKHKFGWDGKSFKWNNTRAMISNFKRVKASPEQASEALCATGFNTIPSWVRPYEVLSTGEKARADLAIELFRNVEIICIDEFTSVIDRNTAMSMSHSVQKYIRRKDLKVVFASCHEDILSTLKPDWIFNPSEGETLYNEELDKESYSIYSIDNIQRGTIVSDLVIE